MSVKVKDVGNYKIHVKESVVQKTWAEAFFIITTAMGLGFDFGWLVYDYHPLIAVAGGISGIISLVSLYCNVFSEPAYYIDTTMYGVGGKTIRRTTPEQDHITICRAAQEFEKEILERIKKEKELEEIVGKCK